MASISRKDLPRYVRECHEAWEKANQKNRTAEIERLKFYAGEQWRDAEIRKREADGQPYVTINKCKPAVDQIEGDIRLNPPGPQCHPVGFGADGDTADIIEGLIRECEYRSGAKTAYSTAGKYVAASGYAVIELATEYVSERDFAQRLVIKSVEDPSCVFFDPNARMANRQDAMWAGKLKSYNRLDYIAEFGNKHVVLESRAAQRMGGWIQDAMGIGGEMAQVNKWTGAGAGPFFVCEFYMVEIENVTLRMYSDNIARYDDEPVPRGVKPLVDEDDPKRYTREVPRRTITKHVVDALEEIKDPTDWLGSLIPLIPVLGPEIYIDGQLHRLSLIAGAIDAQRALNYAATTAVETMGLMSRAPWIGPRGTFDDPRWKDSNTERYAFLEYVPVFVTDETTGAQQLAPPPQKNLFEAAIQWMIGLKQAFADDIKAVTAIYDPSLGQQKGDQSGKAIEQLRSESNVGNYSYADNLHRAIEVVYDQMCCIFPKILDGPRAQTIIRADDQHEVVEINRVFEGDGIDPATGKKGKANNICIGQYSVRVTVGPNFQTRMEQGLVELRELLQVAPQATQVPGVLGRIVRMMGQGNPEMEAIADLLSPPTDQEATPQQMQQALQQLQGENQQIKMVAQRLAQELKSKMPELEYKRWSDTLKAVTQIHVAEITASKDLDTENADREAQALENMLGWAHEAAMQAQEHEHARATQQQDQAAQAASQGADQQHQAEMQDTQNEAAKEQAAMAAENKGGEE